MEEVGKTDIDLGEEKRQVIFGGQRATSLIKEVVAGRLVGGRHYHFDDELVMAIHDRVSMTPGISGFLRQTDSTTVGGEPVRADWQDLPKMMKLFGRWLEEETNLLRENPEDIVMALRVASAAHYGLTMPGFHPFDNGNGRTARALMNAILMSQSYELTAFGLAIPPVPIIRTQKDEGHYLRSLRVVGNTGTLNPFMTFVASKWIESLNERLNNIRSKVKTPKTLADKGLIDKLEWRREKLQKFVHSDQQLFPVPDYFAPRYVKVEHA